jgi:hypothetical protein
VDAMKEANPRSLDMIQFESDSHEAIRTRHNDISYFNLIVADITKIMLSWVNFEVKFIRRQANMVAHALVRTTNSWASFHKIEIVSLYIERLLVNEMH